jgi:hypothetical protein
MFWNLDPGFSILDEYQVFRIEHRFIRLLSFLPLGTLKAERSRGIY